MLPNVSPSINRRRIAWDDDGMSATSNETSNAGSIKRSSGSLLHRCEHFEDQFFFKILRELLPVAKADKDQVETGNNPAVVVVLAAGDDKVRRRIAGQVGKRPPLAPIV